MGLRPLSNQILLAHWTDSRKKWMFQNLSKARSALAVVGKPLDAMASVPPFTRLPNELLIEIYAFSLNPCLPCVSRCLWSGLNTNTARLSFCVSAFSPDSSAMIGKSKATRLHNWIVRKEWFTAQFSENIENAIARNYASRTSVVPTCGAKDIEIPARLLKGSWTNERIDLLGRLIRWGAYILSTPPILDQIPECLLKQAVAQRNVSALQFCLHCLCVKTHPHTMQFIPPTRGGKTMTWSSAELGSVDGIWRLKWDMVSIKTWAEARVMEGDPNGQWLIRMLQPRMAYSE